MYKNTDDLQTRVSKSRTFNNLLAKFSLREKTVLDVGCSSGHYLKHFGKGSIGITIIEDDVRVAKERGLHVIHKNVEDPQFSMEKKFDAIWANNLFEHLHAPHLFLTKMQHALNPQGTLILGVPVIPFFSVLTYFKKFRGAYAVSHINFFTRKTLIEAVRSGGWVVHEARSFYVKNSVLDSFFNMITPHVYIIASPKDNFTYAEKRLRSLKGYK